MGPEFDQEYWDRIDAPIYTGEIGPLLPDTILDFHAHAWRGTDMATQPSEATKSSASLVWTTDNFPTAELLRTAEWLFPGKKYEPMIFGMPYPEIDVGRNNQHIAESVRNYSAVGGVNNGETLGQR